MDYHVNLSVFFLSETGVLEYAAGARKTVTADTNEAAIEEAREWIRRNRKNNSAVPQLRYKVEVMRGEWTWVHDETKDDPLLQPTDATDSCCGGSCHS